MTTPIHVNGSRLFVTRVWARNFKSIRELDLELGPLTVLVGPNASGKSNVLDILRFISHALRESLVSAIRARGGMGDIRHSMPGGRPDVEVGIRVEKGSFRLDYGFVLGRRRTKRKHVVTEGRADAPPESTHANRQFTVDEIIRAFYRVKREYGVVTPANSEEAQFEFEIKEGRLVKPKDMGALEVEQFETTGLAFPSLRRIMFRTTKLGSGQIGGMTQTYRDVYEAMESISRLQFYRLFPDNLRGRQAARDTDLLDEDGSNLAAMLKEMYKRDSLYLGEIKGALGNVVPGLSDLKVPLSGGVPTVKLRYRTGGRPRSTFDLSQESDGTVRLLGMLTALYQERPPSLIGIEEPELTIHPGALAMLAEVIVEAGLRTQVLVTTHSPDLIDRLPIESLRAVQIVDGSTKVGPVSETQAAAVRDGLFTSGELHSMEGLEPRT